MRQVQQHGSSALECIHREWNMENNPILLSGERIDDLQYAGFRLIQNPALFCFSTDAVLLADFVRVPRGARVLDLGAGNGILDVLMYSRQPDASYSAVEISPQLFDLLQRNIAMNGMSSAAACILGDMRDAPAMLGSRSDVVVCNPPYEKAEQGAARKADTHAAARKELLITFREICETAARCLRFGGRFYIVQRAERLAEILATMREAGLEPKLLRLCAAAPDKEPKTCLIMGQKGAHEGMRLLPLLTMRDADGQESAEIRRIYRRDKDD